MSSSRPLIASYSSDDDDPPAPTADAIVQISDPSAAATGTDHGEQQGETGWRWFLNLWSKFKQREEEDDATRRQRETMEKTRREEAMEKEKARRTRNREWWAQQQAAASKCWGCCDLLQKPPLLSKCWSLSDRGLADFLESLANLATMAILTLNIYCATFFLAWHPTDSVCVSGKDIPDDIKVLLKVVSACLPFTALPITLYIAGQAKALQRNLNALGFVSVGVMLEVIYIFALGGVMTVCGASAHVFPVFIVTGIISVVLITAWGCCCRSPRCLRCFCCCCDREEDVENPQVHRD